MPNLDWTAIITSAIGGGGALTVILAGIFAFRGSPKRDRQQADSAVDAAKGTATGAQSAEALKLAQQAMTQAARTEERLVRVETMLGSLRENYRHLYDRARRTMDDWPRVRLHEEPPRLTENLPDPHTENH